MKILSILWSTCSTAAVMVDGVITACVSEERFSRKKNDESYPKNAIEATLRASGVAPEDLDLVVIAGERFDPTGILTHKWSAFSAMDRLKEQKEYWYPKLYENKDVSYLDVFASRIDERQYPGDWSEVLSFLKKGPHSDSDKFFQDFRRKTVAGHLGIEPKKVIFAHHHRAHGYYAYYGSPLDKAKRTLILTADAWGDDMNASVSVADNGRIEMVHSSTDFIIGRLYRYITLVLGMKPDEHEYKVMGLAAYAKPQYYQHALKVFSDTMYVNALGFAYKTKPKDLYFYFKDKLDGYRFDSIAGAIQRYAEEILTEWARNALVATKTDTICFGGGVAMNIKAVMEMIGLDELRSLFICPAPSDESLAIGAAYCAMHDICVSRGQDPRNVLKPLSSAYLGPANSAEEVRQAAKAAKAKGYDVKERPDLSAVAEMLKEGKVIGRCCARSEFGARALGNRSIIADPRKPDVIKKINEKVKSRDFWMPFAPSILSERQDDYLVNGKGIKLPYMTIALNTKPLAQEHLKAGIHQYDLTARPQVVEKSVNGPYHALIGEFERQTGVGGVLNTSFNIHGSPIVQTAGEALEVFEKTELDALLLDDLLIT